MSPGALLAGAAVLSLAELDVTAAGQFMLARPIVLGPLAGLAAGDLLLGGGLGVLYELFSLADPPVGGYLPINPTVALSSGLLLSVGGGVVPALAFPLGLVFGWAHCRVETRLRQRRVKVVRRVERRLALGERPGLGRAAALELLREAGATFAILLAALCGRWLLAGASAAAPWLSAGLKFGLALAPWIGLGAMFRSLRIA